MDAQPERLLVIYLDAGDIQNSTHRIGRLFYVRDIGLPRQVRYLRLQSKDKL